jgi:hypothetical protein
LLDVPLGLLLDEPLEGLPPDDAEPGPASRDPSPDPAPDPAPELPAFSLPEVRAPLSPLPLSPWLLEPASLSDDDDFDPPLDDDRPLEARRSTLAQPEPLKTIDGADIALRIVPSAPHSGQNRGPASLMPWMTSVTRPQLRQA